MEEKTNKTEENDLAAQERMEQIIDQYQTTVYSIAVHLTASEELAAKVVEAVFVQIAREGLPEEEAEIEKLIHQLSYELAIGYLLKGVQDHCSNISSLRSDMVAAADSPLLEMESPQETDLATAFSQSEAMLLDMVNKFAQKKYYC
ncbi:MAG: hypothetical protein IT292_11665 [Deltaproteobacteria bacterium]|nr:hypothetical protein [Deltaproteobacteria bacterium]